MKKGMMKNYFFVALATLVVASCQPKQESMADLIKDRLDRSVEKSLLMAESLKDKPDLLPRSFNAKGDFVTSNSTWWCSGFFPGVLWYLYEYSQSATVLDYARNYTARIEKEKDNTGTHDLGFMLYCSFGNGYRLTGDESYRRRVVSRQIQSDCRLYQIMGFRQMAVSGNY